MHFEQFDVELGLQKILFARVGDEVYSGATVQWSVYGRADRAWMFQALRRVIATWSPEVAELDGRWRFMGEVSGDQLSYVLEHQRDGRWDGVRPWSDLSERGRQEILAGLGQILESVHGLLLIV